MNATYIISIARKLGCSIFLLPEDIIEVNFTYSVMYLMNFSENNIMWTTFSTR